MSKETLQLRYRKTQKILHSRSILAQLYLDIILPLTFCGFALYSLLMIIDIVSRTEYRIEEIFPYLPYLLTALVLGIVLDRIRSVVKRELNLAGNKLLRDVTNEPSTAAIVNSFKEIAKKVGFENLQVRYWLSTRDGSAVPSVITNRGQVDFVFPLGFLKLHRQKPDLAAALIAHELGHIVNNDADRLLKTWAFMNIGYRILLPINIIGLIIDLGSILLIISTMTKYAYQTVDTISFLQLGGLATIRCLIFTLSLLFLFRLRQFHFMSERLADGIALLYTEPMSLKNALQEVEYISPFKMDWLSKITSIHPSARQRLEDIDSDILEYYKPN